jgi:hypothetical protein
MSLLKQQVLNMVSAIDDEKLLALLKADIEYFDKHEDILDELSNVDKEELKELAKERSDKDTLTNEEFREATKKWRSQ